MGTQEINNYECAPNLNQHLLQKSYDKLQNHQVILYKNYKRLQELYRNSRDQTKCHGQMRGRLFLRLHFKERVRRSFYNIYRYTT